jgi:hypothetical protein
VQDRNRDRSVFLEPVVAGSVHEHALNHPNRLAPRSKLKPRDLGKSVRRVIIILLIVAVLAIWISSRVGASPVGTVLTNY